jgi:molybdate transport system regulatory protein
LQYVLKNTKSKFVFGLKQQKAPFLGIEKIWLLENIQKTGSITNAAKEMKMAYRQAWQLVEEMNQRRKYFGRKTIGR